MQGNRVVLMVLAAITFAACSPYQKVLKSENSTEKFNAAFKYFTKKDYGRAMPLWEDLLTRYRGQDSSELVYYYYCYTQLNVGDFDMAAYHFKYFNETFFNTKHEEEMAYMYPFCLYKSTMPSYLDQTDTKKAIAEFQLFLNLYPNSAYRENCNTFIDKLRKRLHEKAFNNAYLYYKTGHYKAASVALKNCVKEYPDIDRKEELEFLSVKSSYLLAINSIEIKKAERLQTSIDAAKELLKENKTSAYATEVNLLIAKAQKQLNQLINK